MGDERYEQRTLLGPSIPASRRVLLSEVLFVYLAEEQSWLTARIVRRVDGKPIPESDTRLERLLADTSSSWPVRLRRLRDEGARFDIGRVERNFSDPTMVLQFLSRDTQGRFEFRLDGDESVADTPAWKVSFQEQARPTMIQSNGRDVPASGTVWLAVRDSSVLRTQVTLVDRVFELRVRGSMRVSYRHDSRLGVWLPAEMRELYDQNGRGVYRGRSALFDDRIECVATYSNFRRFETTARLVN
jgi:hypothetical protein